uniref:Uncharacterized protein n=1 Tax=viral metagenome TaxID=1070528 RepID=A0A6M3X857_9ZZZZ
MDNMQRAYTLRKRLRTVNSIQVTVPLSLIEPYASQEGLTVEEFIKEYKIQWIKNTDTISVQFVKEKVEIITSNEFLQEHEWRGQNMLWESILSKLKPDEVIKFECQSHLQAKYKQSSLLGSIRNSRNKTFTGKITTSVSGNTLYIRLKKEEQANVVSPIV